MAYYSQANTSKYMTNNIFLSSNNLRVFNYYLSHHHFMIKGTIITIKLKFPWKPEEGDRGKRSGSRRNSAAASFRSRG